MLIDWDLGKAVCFVEPRLHLGKYRPSRVHKTYCFPRSQSISVNYARNRNIDFSKYRV